MSDERFASSLVLPGVDAAVQHPYDEENLLLPAVQIQAAPNAEVATSSRPSQATRTKIQPIEPHCFYNPVPIPPWAKNRHSPEATDKRATTPPIPDWYRTCTMDFRPVPGDYFLSPSSTRGSPTSSSSRRMPDQLFPLDECLPMDLDMLDPPRGLNSFMDSPVRDRRRHASPAESVSSSDSNISEETICGDTESTMCEDCFPAPALSESRSPPDEIEVPEPAGFEASTDTMAIEGQPRLPY
ncbi:hypothetical protein B0T19DRAFT_405270 [Cercophora scortea]|uniref:Uncharacterized protein n=1 Tax=Cercophora scortea TaxID=314031 RepID=A0AAE0I4T8_9PEZI|nr:hypothetical protein B0T19DRAFT_405270 [Cercophora scortea]